MPVKGELLLYVLSGMAICYLSSAFAKIIAVIALLIWYAYFHAHSTICFLLFLIGVCFWIQPSAVQKMKDVVQVVAVHADYAIVSDGKTQGIAYGLDDVNYDEVLRLTGTWKPIVSLQNFYGFSFAKWCNRRGIYEQWQGTYEKIAAKDTLRSRLYAHVQKLPKNARSYVSGFLFGALKRSDDLAYLMQAGGFHVSALFLFLRRFIARFSVKHARFLAYLLGFLLVSITKESAAIQRVLVFEFVACLPIENQKDRFAFAVLLSVLLFPYLLYEYGFLLACSIRMIFLFVQGRWKQRIMLWAVLIAFQLFAFYECSLLQLLLFPLYRRIFAFAYLFAWGIVFFPLLGGLAGAMEVVLKWVLSWPNDLLSLSGKPSFLWLLLWGRTIAYLIKHTEKKSMIKAMMLLAVFPYQAYLHPFGEVMMIDVGQGDCFLFTLPFHQGTMLIDVAGSLYKNIPEQTLQPILKAKGIDVIDIVVVTHDDYDHSGGLQELKEIVRVKQVIDAYQPTVALGKQLWYMPMDTSAYDNENDRSLLLYGQLGKHRYLFMGDAGIAVEEELMRRYPQLDCDVLKLGHHGSHTGTSSLFLQQVNPQMALISAGRNNRYGHPHEEVLSRLQSYAIYYQNTAEKGALRIYYTPWFSFFVNSAHEFGFLK